MYKQCTFCRLDDFAGNHDPNCPNNPDKPRTFEIVKGPVGWICPKCGRGNSPKSRCCPCVQGPTCTHNTGMSR
jgi:hypothetical protein